MRKTRLNRVFAIYCIRLFLSLLCIPIVIASAALAKERQFDLSIEEVTIKVAPKLDYKVFGFNGQVPGPLIHVQEGDDVIVNVQNNTSLPHTIHWHGIPQTGSWQSDGVPGVSQKQIEAGDSYTYRFKADRIGTLWYHCHVNVNEHVGVRGMWGPLIVDPKKPLAIEKRVTQDAIMMLSTWESAVADRYGEGGTPQHTEDYFSVNAKSFPLSQPIRVKKGDVLRVRFIGAGGATHSMHSHGHDMMVTHKDGLPLETPYMADTVMVGPGERYDVIIEANNPGRFIFHDHVDKHVTGGGKFPAGPITVMEYDGIPVDDWYVWKDIKFDSNFYYGDSLKKGYGMFDHTPFKGKSESRRSRR